jgi:hypothetical protein
MTDGVVPSLLSSENATSVLTFDYLVPFLSFSLSTPALGLQRPLMYCLVATLSLVWKQIPILNCDMLKQRDILSIVKCIDAHLLM